MRLSGAAGMVVEAPELIPLCFPGADVLGGLVGEESMRCQQAAQPVRLTPPLVPPTVVVSAAAEKVRRRRFVGRSSRLGVRLEDGQRRHLPAPAVRLRHPLRRRSLGGAGASIGRHRAEAPPSGGLGQARAGPGGPGPGWSLLESG